MRNSPFDTFIDLLEEMGRTFTAVVRRGSRAIAGMSWPALLLFCVVLAMMISIVPLALFLFAVFLAIKLIVGAIVLGSRRDKMPPHDNGTGQ
jgi:hypothetical protein